MCLAWQTVCSILDTCLSGHLKSLPAGRGEGIRAFTVTTKWLPRRFARPKLTSSQPGLVTIVDVSIKQKQKSNQPKRHSPKSSRKWRSLGASLFDLAKESSSAATTLIEFRLLIPCNWMRAVRSFVRFLADLVDAVIPIPALTHPTPSRAYGSWSGKVVARGDFNLFALCDRRYWAVATGSSYRRSPVGGRTYRASPTSSRIRRTCSWIMESRLRVGSWSKRMSISWREWLMEALVWISKSSCATVGGLPSCRNVH